MSVRIIVGDCRASLAALPERSVQTCVTSPPYFGLRDYGHAGQLGLEPTPDEYVAAMVEVFRAVRRVLRDDGTVWLNLGDSYAATTRSSGASMKSTLATRPTADKTAAQRERGSWRSGMGDAKSKDLLGIPWRVAFALQADGWYLRSDIVWAKPNPMPESVTDRPTKAHEYVFLLSKSERYFYDADAIAEPVAREWDERNGPVGRNGLSVEHGGQRSPQTGAGTTSRNARSVWTIATQPYSGAHFATMPPALAERCVLAGSAKQACETCGAAWARVTERVGDVPEYGGGKAAALRATGAANHRSAQGPSGNGLGVRPVQTLGFAPSCSCATNTGAGRSVVLDPFGGAGTTGLVADRLGRDAILCELNPEYAALAESRILNDNPLFSTVEVA
jgi:DNA modification methylase